jgi:hypothetical protein
VTDIPHQVAEIDVRWLNEVLGGSIGAVAALELERLGEGVGILGELGRLRLTYEPGQRGPSSLIAKCQSPAPENQFLAQMMGFYQREVNFYQHEAAHVGIRVPHPYHAAIDPSGTPFVLLVEDIAGARCPDQITGITEHEARRIIDVVAGLHARYWDSAAELSWLPPMNNPLYKAGQQLAEMRWPGFADRFGDRIGDEMMDVVKQACDNYAAMLDFVATDGHTTFTHTDCRAENYLFVDDEQPPVMIDFQLCTRHFGPWDVANLIGGSMSPDVRRTCEASLVEHYHRSLVSRGVGDYALDRCWRDYRLSLLQMCTASVIVSDLQGGNERGAELLENLFLRPIIAATDHHVGDLLPEFCS